MGVPRVYAVVCIPVWFVAAAAALLRLAPLPYFWIWALLTLTILGMTAWLQPMRRSAVLWINLAALPSAFAVAEVYFWAMDPSKFLDERREPASGYRQFDPQIGFGPVPNTVLRHQVLHRPTREKLFDSRFTIGPKGLRVTNNDSGASVQGCVWVFGDSFAFGHGLNDEQTLPYLLGAKSMKRYRIHNLAFGGYGPHQMLASIESGHAASRVDCEPDLVIFEGVPDDARRAAGFTDWDPHGPRYTLNEQGRAVNGGHFDDRAGVLDRWSDQLKKSRTWMKMVTNQVVLVSSHAELFSAIVQASHEAIVLKYPHARFVGLFWNESGSPISPLIIASLRVRAVPFVLISDVLDIDDPKYRIHRYDSHPSADANERIAEYLAPRLACIPKCDSAIR